MSRISRYQGSIERFIKQKSYITIIENEGVKGVINKMCGDSMHLIGILILTIVNSQAKRTSQNVHGYPLAAGIEYMEYVIDLVEQRDDYDCTYGKNTIEELIARVGGVFNIALSTNIGNSTNKHIGPITMNVNANIHKIQCEPTIGFEKQFEKSDIIKYKFSDEKKAIEQLKSLRKLTLESLTTINDDRYGFICRTGLTLGWLIGGGEQKKLNDVTRLASSFAVMIKTIKDFKNLERDISKAKLYTLNTVINEGFQVSFEKFLDHKQKVIEICIKLDIYTNTVKEIVDLLELDMDQVIDKSSPDLVSQYTL